MPDYAIDLKEFQKKVMPKSYQIPEIKRYNLKSAVKVLENIPSVINYNSKLDIGKPNTFPTDTKYSGNFSNLIKYAPKYNPKDIKYRN